MWCILPDSDLASTTLSVTSVTNSGSVMVSTPPTAAPTPDGRGVAMYDTVFSPTPPVVVASSISLLDLANGTSQLIATLSTSINSGDGHHVVVSDGHSARIRDV